MYTINTALIKRIAKDCIYKYTLTKRCMVQYYIHINIVLSVHRSDLNQFGHSWAVYIVSS